MFRCLLLIGFLFSTSAQAVPTMGHKMMVATPTPLSASLATDIIESLPEAFTKTGL